MMQNDNRESPKPGVVWAGAFFDNYSLAHTNREIALELADKLDLSIINKGERQFKTEHEPRFSPLDKLVNRSLIKVDFHVRHQWPPDFDTPCLGRYVLMQPWEYGYIPVCWLEPIKNWVLEVWGPSNYVRDCYIRSGVAPEKVKVVPSGINPREFHPKVTPVRLKTNKGFKFLFIGGTIYRKGFDILLAAYADEFTKEEDVCLVVKDFFYGGEGYKSILAKQRQNQNCPEVLYMYGDVLPSQIAGFYTACDCYVHPYRGEGYGLPIAEAMACGLPVIVTGKGACRDFCHQDNAYLISAAKEWSYEKAVYSMETPGYPFWYRPDKEHLQRLMRYVFENREEAKARGLLAQQEISTKHTWAKTAEVIMERLLAFKDR